MIDITYKVVTHAKFFLAVKMAGEIIVDALPYIDQGYDEPGVREAVRKLRLSETVFKI